MNTSNQTLERLVKKPRPTAFSYKPTILQVFLNADLRGSHNRLIELAKSQKLDLSELEQNQAVVFINKKRTLMKIYVTGNTFSFTRRDRIDLEAIKHIPRAFGASGDFSYDKALEASLIERLGKKVKEGLH